MFGFGKKDKTTQPEKPQNNLPLKNQLERPRAGFGKRLRQMFTFGRKIDDELLEELETLLLTADVGAETTQAIIDDLTGRVKRKELDDPGRLMEVLRELLIARLQPVAQPLTPNVDGSPFVIMVVGVNGAGKTTTIGKLSQRLSQDGTKVMLAAGDTFRAAAVEQLKTWGERISVPVIAQDTGSDSASVIFDALQAAQARGMDVLIADTAGRLHTQSNLMEELKKIKRVMGKLDPNAPHEVLLVLDGTSGQNALSQAAEFGQAVGVTGLAVTKLDGTAKGGVVFALAQKFGLPIRFIGVGERAADLQVFDPAAFVDALL